jgi:PDZ domain-containing protein
MKRVDSASTFVRDLVALVGMALSLPLSVQAATPPAEADRHAAQPAGFGALVDSTRGDAARDGLHVLGATPGSSADRAGLRPGDVIVAVNGTSLRGLGSDEQGRALAASTLRRIVEDLPDSATLTFDVVRGGGALTLSAAMHAPGVPVLNAALGAAATAAGGCGRISAFDVAPRGERLYAARILLLDGTTPGPHGTPSFRVAAGEHRLLVAENIPTQALGVGEIATLRRQTSKPLTVVVEPGMTAMVAAQLQLRNAADLSRGTYWDPVVWKQIAEPCP